jgi:hypothetical protein
MTDDYNQKYNENDLENQYNKGFLAGEKSKEEEVIGIIKKDIEWYESYEIDGEKDKEILQQAKAIISELRDLLSKIQVPKKAEGKGK